MTNPTGRPRKGTSPSKLSPTEMQALQRAGQSPAEIAKQAGITPQSVYFHLRKLSHSHVSHQEITPGLAIYIYRQYRERGRTVQSLAAEANISINDVRRIIKTRGNYPPDARE